MNILNKIFLYSICILTLAGLLPFLLNSLYVHPAIDDYAHAYRLFEATIWETIVDVYYNWSGRYFGTLISAINPLLFPIKSLSAWYSIITILSLVASIYILLHSLCSSKISKIQICALSGIVIVPFLVYIPDIYAWFYWFSGYITYTLSTSAFLILSAVVYKYIQNPKSHFFTLSTITVLLFIIAGSNVINLIHTYAAFLLFFVVIKPFHKQKKVYVIIGILSFFSLIFVLAPGNYERARICNVSVSVINAAYISLFYTKEFFIRYAGMFLSTGAIYLTLFAPALHNPHKYKYRNPLIIAAIGIITLFVLQFFSLYTTFTALLYRTENSTVLIALLLWLFFLQRVYSQWLIQTHISKYLHKKVVQIISIILFTLPLFSTNSSITVAYKDFILGESAAYNKIRIIQDSILRKSTGKKTVEIPTLTSYPETLLPKPLPRQNGLYEEMTRLLFMFHANKYYAVDSIIISKDTVKRHPIYRTKTWNYEE
jgi:hypothetical protein